VPAMRLRGVGRMRSNQIVIGYITDAGYRCTYTPGLCDLCGQAGMLQGTVLLERVKDKATRPAHFIVHRRVPTLFRSGYAPPTCPDCIEKAELWEAKAVKPE
jgi:hypothetical protein